MPGAEAVTKPQKTSWASLRWNDFWSFFWNGFLTDMAPRLITDFQSGWRWLRS